MVGSYLVQERSRSAERHAVIFKGKSSVLGLSLLGGKRFVDERGFFAAPYVRDAGLQEEMGDLIQMSHSRSFKNVLRGLHYQYPKAQGKLVYAAEGYVLDVVVDVREKSPTFGKHEKFLLGDEDLLGLYVPPGFAHGILALSEEVDFIYLITHSAYSPEGEHTLRWDDPHLGIDWGGCEKPIVSSKDLAGLSLEELRLQNKLPSL